MRGRSERCGGRAAADHVLRLIGDCDCVDSLVLRGSMTLLAWAPEQAREPGDLDFVVRPVAGVPVDDLHPYPYVNQPAEIGAFDEVETGALHPRLPPEGL